MEKRIEYRGAASNALVRAKAELASTDAHRIRYAALELRFAMEALTYDRALAYEEEIPPSEYNTWQPRKVMSLLLEINPTADKDSSVTIGLEETFGVPPDTMHSLGTEKVFNLALLKEHYDAIGSYLHMPIFKKFISNKQEDYKRLRKRCDDVIVFMEEALESPVFNITLGSFHTIDCSDCGKPIRKRIPLDAKETVATCHNCQVTYKISIAPNREASWQLDREVVNCASKCCSHPLVWLRRDIKVGAQQVCGSCRSVNKLVLTMAINSGNIATQAKK